MLSVSSSLTVRRVSISPSVSTPDTKRWCLISISCITLKRGTPSAVNGRNALDQKERIFIRAEGSKRRWKERSLAHPVPPEHHMPHTLLAKVKRVCTSLPIVRFTEHVIRSSRLLLARSDWMGCPTKRAIFKLTGTSQCPTATARHSRQKKIARAPASVAFGGHCLIPVGHPSLSMAALPSAKPRRCPPCRQRSTIHWTTHPRPPRHRPHPLTWIPGMRHYSRPRSENLMWPGTLLKILMTKSRMRRHRRQLRLTCKTQGVIFR
mmetsp:Transcript_20581/g.47556  ORF Transcript_20581/g.47556 Transcript_20581/m.47556 type:complete len:264 (+) Transcript_20581:253-1044(+)